MERKSKFDEFLFALICLADERDKAKPSVEVIDSWYRRAQGLFEAVVSEAVRREVESINLRIVVEEKRQAQG